MIFCLVQLYIDDFLIGDRGATELAHALAENHNATFVCCMCHCVSAVLGGTPYDCACYCVSIMLGIYSVQRGFSAPCSFPSQTTR